VPKQHVSKTFALTVNPSGGGVRPKPNGPNKSSAQYANLLAWFPLYVDSVSASAVDLVNGLVGTPANVANQNDPKFGWVYKGDGAVRHYKVPYPALLDFGYKTDKSQARPFTVTFWGNTTVKPSQLPGGGNQMYAYSFDNPNPAYPGHAMALSCSAGGDPNTAPLVTQMAIDDVSAQSSMYGNKKVNDGLWHHFAFVVPYNGNGQWFNCSTYVDGVLDVTGNGTLTGPNPMMPPCASPGTSQPLYVGTDDDGTSSPYNGLMADLRFYLGALSLSTLAAMQAGKPTQWELYA
jgi:hypothetical protein